MLRSWVSPPSRRITIVKTLAHPAARVRNRHHADCRVAAERYTLICDGPEILRLHGLD